MANKHAQAIINSIVDRWSATHNPAAGTTCVASVAALSSGRHVLTNILASCRNATAAAVTVTVSVRDASIAGTVLAQADMVVSPADYALAALPVAIPGVKNSGLFAEFGTPAASVTQKLTIAGWTEDPR